MSRYRFVVMADMELSQAAEISKLINNVKFYAKRLESLVKEWSVISVHHTDGDGLKSEFRFCCGDGVGNIREILSEIVRADVARSIEQLADMGVRMVLPSNEGEGDD